MPIYKDIYILDNATSHGILSKDNALSNPSRGPEADSDNLIDSDLCDNLEFDRNIDNNAYFRENSNDAKTLILLIPQLVMIPTILILILRRTSGTPQDGQID